MWPFAKVVAVLASNGMDGHEEGQDTSPSKVAGYVYVVVSSHYQSYQCSLSLSYTQRGKEVRAWVLQRLGVHSL